MNPVRLQASGRWILRTILAVALCAVVFVLYTTFNVSDADAAINRQINYQGKLTDASGDAVQDDDYNMEFALYTASSGGSPIWTETRTGTDTVDVVSGLFSVMLGSVTTLDGIDFNQTLYLGVNIGGTSTPGWDGEMTPRKIIGAVPAAIEAYNLGGASSTQYLRTDMPGTIATTTSSSVLTITQTGSGDILDLYSGATSVLAVSSNGFVGIGTTTPGSLLSVGDTNGINFSTATSTFSTTGGINLSEGCFAVGGTCVGGSGTVNSGTTGQFAYYDADGTSVVGTSTIYVSPEGLVGIGVDTGLLEKFTVNGNMQLTTTSRIDFGGQALQVAGDSTGLTIAESTGANGYVAIDTANTRRVTVTHGGNMGIGTTSPSSKLVVVGETVARNFTATSSIASTFPYASSTALTVSGTAYIGSLTGPLQAVSGRVSASSTISTVFGGTGLSSNPSYGNVLVGNSSGGYTLMSTSSLNIASGGGGSGTVNSGTTGQFAYYAADGTAVSGTSSIFLSTAGNVGIGTSSPMTRLTVQGVGGSNPSFAIGESASGQPVWMRMQQYALNSSFELGVAGTAGQFMTDTVAGDSIFKAYGTGATGIAFGIGTAPTASLYLKSGGNVGIGTTSPGSNLSVNGVGYFSSYVTVGSSYRIGDNRALTGDPSSRNWMIGDSGNLSLSGQWNNLIGSDAGLNLTSGSDNTFIGDAAGSSLTNPTGNTLIGSNATADVDGLTNATAIGYNAVVSSSNAIVLGGTGSNAVNVGIGTTTPGTLLSIGDTNGINFTTATSTFSSSGGINLSSGCFAIGGTCVTGGGGSGSGTVNTGTIGQLAYYAANGTAVSGTSSLFLSTAGNVGIGTTSPGYKLAVNGNAFVNGYLAIATTSGAVVVGSISGSTRGEKAVDIQSSHSIIGEVASGDYSIAIGQDNEASALQSRAFGITNVVDGVNGTAIGSSNHISGIDSLGVGTSNVLTTDYAVAFGLNNVSYGSTTLTVGHSNTTRGTVTGAFGYGNSVDGQTTYALGVSNTLAGTDVYALGSNNYVPKDNSVAIGSRQYINTLTSTGVGYNNTIGTSTGLGNSHVFGANNTLYVDSGSSADYVVVAGNSNVSYGNLNSIFGSNNSTTDAGSNFLGGFGNTLTLSGSSTVIGTQNLVSSGYNTVTLGVGNAISGGNTIGIGLQNITTAGSAIAIGSHNEAGGNFSVSLGNSVTASGDHSIGIGYLTETEGNDSIAIGTNNAVSNTSHNTAAIGYGNSAFGLKSSIFGSYNVTSSNAGSSTLIGNLNSSSATNTTVLGTGITNGIADSVMIGPSDAAKITINSNGSVGIGTTTPSSKLSVSGQSQTLTDGTTWIERTGLPGDGWYSVTYGEGLFVAVAHDEVLTSEDGFTWTLRTAAADESWISVTYGDGDGQFVAVSLGGDVMTSPDGITWSSQTSVTAIWRSVTYGNGTYVAVASSGTNRVMTSPDGVTWTGQSASEASSWSSVTYAEGKFVAVAEGGTNRVMTSSNGTSWTSQTTPETHVWSSVTYGDGTFVAVGTGAVMTSPDGVTWTEQTPAESNIWRGVTYGNGIFLAVAQDGTHRVMTSPDGVTWTSQTAAEANGWVSVAYGDGTFVAVTDGNKIMTTYTDTGTDMFGVSNVFGTNVFNITDEGNIGIGTTSPHAKLALHVSASDIYTDTLFSISSSTTAYATSTHLSVMANGNVGIGTNAPSEKLHITGGNVLIGSRDDTSTDWAEKTGDSGAIAEDGGSTSGIDKVTASVVYNGSLYVGTTETDKAEVYRYDGSSTWTKVSQAAGTIAEDAGASTTIDGISAMAVYNGYLYVGTTESNRAQVYRYDGGSTWTALNYPNISGRFAVTANIDGVSAMAVHNGSLFIGTSEANAAQVYRYDGGTVWTVINTTAGTFNTTTLVDTVSAMLSANGFLWIGTSETNLAQLLRWDGIVSAAPFTRTNPTAGTFQTTTAIDGITSIAVHNGALFIGTSETNLAEIYQYNFGTAVIDFAKVSSTTGTIGAPSGGTTAIDKVTALTVYNGYLYAGTSESTKAEVYRFDAGYSWTKVTNSTAGGVSVTSPPTTSIDEVLVLQNYNGKLYAGTSKAYGAQVYEYEEVEGMSYALNFNGASDNAEAEQNGFMNTGSIRFTGEDTARGGTTGDNSSGKFIFSHAISTAYGAYDLAEDYPTRDDGLKPGDLVSLDLDEKGFVKRSAGKSDKNIIGVYSEKPALRLSQQGDMIDDAKAVPIALTGRVKVKVNLENGAIHIGDYLTSSSERGDAMRAVRPGRVIGRALSAYEGAEGQDAEVMVFIGAETIGWGDVAQAQADAQQMEFVDAGAEFVQKVKDSVADLAFAALTEVENVSLIITNKITAIAASIKELFVGRVTVLPDGEVNVPAGENQIAGTGVLLAGQTSILVANDAVRPGSKIFITLTTLANSPLTVTEHQNGIGFKVEIAQPQEWDVTFDWLIIQSYDAISGEEPPVVETVETGETTETVPADGQVTETESETETEITDEAGTGATTEGSTDADAADTEATDTGTTSIGTEDTGTADTGTQGEVPADEETPDVVEDAAETVDIVDEPVPTETTEEVVEETEEPEESVPEEEPSAEEEPVDNSVEETITE